MACLIPQRLSVEEIAASVAAMLRTVSMAAAQEYIDQIGQAVGPLRERMAGYADEAARLERLVAASGTAAEICPLNDRLVAVARDSYLVFRSAPFVHELCTRVRDCIARRCLELATAQADFTGLHSSRELALLALGSDGRGEQTLLTDQDYMFMYSDGDDDADGYFAALGGLFAQNLEQAGIMRCTGGIMPCNEEWRGSQRQWRRRLASMVRYDDDDWARNVLNLTILSDARTVTGPPALSSWFGPAVREAERENFRAIWNMARIAADMPIANSFFSRFRVEGDGPHKGEMNIKLNAWAPLVMCIRVLAISAGIEETGTLARIEALRAEGSLGEAAATGVREAYLVITGRRILAQMRKLDGVTADANFINPYGLRGDERERLHAAMVAVEKLQKLLRCNYSTG